MVAIGDGRAKRDFCVHGEVLVQAERRWLTATTFVVGSRKSQLALVQTEHVRAKLRALDASLQLPLTTMTTTGDHILDTPLAQIGEKSLFTKELEYALLNGGVDLVVHSLKDLPTTLPPSLVIGAVLEREDPRDAVVLRKDLADGALGSQVREQGLGALPEGSVVGTSSVRRRAQLKRAYPHLKFHDVRGNLNTRLRKLDTLLMSEAEEQSKAADQHVYTALILAAAGLNRLGWQPRTTTLLPPDACLHAVGQGALAVECRADDTRTLALLARLEHAGTRVRAEAERAVMRTLEGGCSVPIGVWTELTLADGKSASAADAADQWRTYASLAGARLTLRAAVVSVNGEEHVGATQSIMQAQATALGNALAQELQKAGADRILASIQKH
ncbi:porphobilinogen deaminase [Thamnocephalis sphaerospora]|uniref:hydroxymethylbilane synthase n=1 Tax=Thamnocephalis sphaerospora TaxID=78915 RepID=A0A4P9XV84_9FUNG|nr:porphobilinogen deaminase [Thamnocephalis sphaerospora]|eukprot:RKP10173.1 porphobilinogen deaminase [Thamnocephalis sphaerospora]